MTNERRQRILCVIADDNGHYYYNGPLDGIWGTESKKAAERFVADFSGETKSEKSATGSFWDDSEFFDREEFRCQCAGKYCDGFPVEPKEELVLVCNEIRRRLGVPVSIVDGGGSGVRCPEHNAAVGGVRNSNHLYGKAADLHSEKSPQEMARVAESVMGSTGEIGIYSWGIHIAIDCEYSRFYG